LDERDIAVLAPTSKRLGFFLLLFIFLTGVWGMGHFPVSCKTRQQRTVPAHLGVPTANKAATGVLFSRLD
jgi:hypothetical protein